MITQRPRAACTTPVNFSRRRVAQNQPSKLNVPENQAVKIMSVHASETVFVLKELNMIQHGME